MKYLIRAEVNLARHCYFLQTPGSGFGGLPEAPKGFKDLAIENIGLFLEHVPSTERGEALKGFLRAGRNYVQALPNYPTEDFQNYSDEELTVLSFFTKPAIEIKNYFLGELEILDVEGEEDEIDFNPDLFWRNKFKEWILVVTTQGAIFRSI